MKLWRRKHQCAAVALCVLLLPVQAYAMAVYVAAANNPTLTLDVEPSDNIEAVKAKIYDQNGMAPADQRLFYNGTELLDGYSLSDYSVPGNATLQLVPVAQPPSDITLSDATVPQSGGAAAIVGQFATVDADANDTFTYRLVAGDGDGDNGQFNIVGSQLYANDTGVMASGAYSIRVETNDTTSVFSKAFTVTVVDDLAPTNLALNGATIAENAAAVSVVGMLSATSLGGGSFALVAGTGDEGNGAFTISGAELRSAATFDYEAASQYSIRVEARDPANNAVAAAFVISVTNRNEAPVISSSAPTSGTEDALWTYAVQVNDVDDTNASLAWSLPQAPAGMQIDTSGVITWVPQDGVLTSGSVVVQVVDGGEDGAEAASEEFVVSVNAVNDAPSASDIATSAFEAKPKEIVLIGADIDSAVLVYELVGNPVGGSAEQAGDIATFTVDLAHEGEASFQYRVSDGALLSNIATVTIAVVLDADGDEVADSDDLDADNDGIIDIVEHEGDLDVTGDDDDDGVADHRDLDSDGDGIADVVEAGLSDLDSNADGMLDGDVGDNGFLDTLETTPDSGTPTFELPDTDADGVPNAMDIDSDSDGIDDALEGSDDADGDGLANSVDADSDGDSLTDAVERGSADLPRDTDGEGVPDYLDVDSDDDAVADGIDNCVTGANPYQDDLDEDGVGDGCDAAIGSAQDRGAVVDHCLEASDGGDAGDAEVYRRACGEKLELGGGQNCRNAAALPVFPCLLALLIVAELVRCVRRRGEFG